MLLNGQAVAYIHMGKFEDAESFLQEALDKVSFAILVIYFFVFTSVEQFYPEEELYSLLCVLKRIVSNWPLSLK